MFVCVCGILSMQASGILLGPWPRAPLVWKWNFAWSLARAPWCGGGRLVSPWPGPPCGGGRLVGPWPKGPVGVEVDVWLVPGQGPFDVEVDVWLVPGQGPRWCGGGRLVGPWPRAPLVWRWMFG